ncbi:manganese peroxidase 2 [Rickenella mellea]|uniref:Peroxidase n=1 Tax=Rickenella mellea TaxID=50990 RepID=A0A4Y7PZP3_9AGAM|nr:manganese peroxidase 2 [Rickenella mellea]
MVFKLSLALVALATAASAANFRRVACPDGVNTAVNEACCVFHTLRDQLQANAFENQCGEEVHEVLRLTFHDAIGFSKSGALAGGGADGSMILFDSIETAFAANAGIDESVDLLAPFMAQTGVSAGDLIQFAGAVGITNCPGAPKLSFLAGRPNATGPADDGTVPEPQQSTDVIFARMADANFSPTELVHLLASHTIARSDHVDPTIQQVPFDTTPFTFDTQFFLEVLLKGTGFPGTAGNSGEVESPLAAEGEMRLESDFAIARDPSTACEWQAQINNQQLMMSNFKSAMEKMALIGQDSSNFIDCSEAVPDPIAPNGKDATFPAGTGPEDLEQACASPFPTLQTDPGAATDIPKNPS